MGRRGKGKGGMEGEALGPAPLHIISGYATAAEKHPSAPYLVDCQEYAADFISDLHWLPTIWLTAKIKGFYMS